MLAESQPRLSNTVPTFELLMKSWETLAKKIPHLKPWIDHGLGWVYKYYKHMDNKDAYILAMCMYLFFINFIVSHLQQSLIPPLTLCGLNSTGTVTVSRAPKI